MIGICDSAGALVHRAARAAGAPLPEGKLDGVGYYGLNHLGWLYRLESGGKDLLPGLLADAAALSGFEEGRLFPQPFLPWAACPTSTCITTTNGAGRRRHPRPCRRPAASPSTSSSPGCTPRLPRPAPAAYELWDAARRSREEGYLAEARPSGEQRDEDDLAGGGYERVALGVMRALSGGRRARAAPSSS